MRVSPQCHRIPILGTTSRRNLHLDGRGRITAWIADGGARNVDRDRVPSSSWPSDPLAGWNFTAHISNCPGRMGWHVRFVAATPNCPQCHASLPGKRIGRLVLTFPTECPWCGCLLERRPYGCFSMTVLMTGVGFAKAIYDDAYGGGWVTNLIFYTIIMSFWHGWLRPPCVVPPPLPPPLPLPGECEQCGISLKPRRVRCHWCGWEPEKGAENAPASNVPTRSRETEPPQKDESTRGAGG